MTMPFPRSIAALLTIAATAATAATIHFDPTYQGTDSDGSETRPWKSLDRCFTTASPGDICLLEPGAYNLATPQGGSLGRVTRSGTATAPIRVEARFPGSVHIGAWHDVTWTRVGTINRWVATMVTPLAANVSTLQSVWQGRLNQSGVQLWYLNRRAALQQATWPMNLSMFPATAYLQPGTTNTSYNLEGLPVGSLAKAKAHVFRDEEQGAAVREVRLRSGTSTLTVEPTGEDDYLFNRNSYRRVWLSSHPDLLAVNPEGRWTVDPQTGLVYVAMSFDPLQSYVLQVSAVGPDLSNISYWTFRNIGFMGVVPITDANTTGLRFDGVTFDRPGLHDGLSEFDASEASRTGFVLEGSNHVVERSYFSGCPLNCLELLGSNIKVRNNLFTYSQLKGGAYHGAVHVMGANAEIRHNVITEAGGSGIVINRDATNARVSRNRVENWGRLTASRVGGVAAMFRTTSPIEIDSNLIINYAIQNPPQLDLRPGGAINLMFSRNLAFVHHNIIENSNVGIRLGGWFGMPDNTSNDHKIYNNSIGAGVTYSWLNAPTTSNRLAGTRMVNNIYRTRMAFVSPSDEFTLSPYSPLGLMAGGFQSNNLVPELNPLFRNPVAEDWDFGLLTGSPAIDAGAPYLLPNGQTLAFNGSAPDIGAMELGTTWTAGNQPYVPEVPATAFSLDDPSTWQIPGDQPVVATSTKTEGSGAFEITPTGYKVLQSPAVNQSAIAGLGFVTLDARISAIQSNPWWVGAVQIYIEVPSRGLWNQWVGQWELTGRPQGEWQTLRLPLPSYITSQLQDANYSDLKVRIAVNLNPGSGPLILDNLRFDP